LTTLKKKTDIVNFIYLVQKKVWKKPDKSQEKVMKMTEKRQEFLEKI
jgi:hypothetical protein